MEKIDVFKNKNVTVENMGYGGSRSQ